MRVAINWAAGGQPTIMKVVDGVPGQFPNPAYGGLQGLGLALFTLVLILALIRWGGGFVKNVSVLLGIVGGALMAAVLGLMHFDKVGKAASHGCVRLTNWDVRRLAGLVERGAKVEFKD